MKSRFHQNPIPNVNLVHLNVLDIHRSIKFYTDIMGFTILKQEITKVYLTVNGKDPILIIEQPVGIKPKTKHTAGLYHFAILLPSRKELARFLKHLITKNVYIQGGSDHGFSEALYFADPDGNGIEVYRDKPEEEWLYDEDGNIKGITTYLDIDGLEGLLDNIPFTKLPEDTVMGHIHLHVNNLDKADHFYIDGLGMDLVMKYGPQASFYSYGGYHHHIGANIWGRPQDINDPINVGLNNYTIQYYNLTELNETVNRLKSLGYKVDKEDNYYLTQDPSGNLIKLHI